MGRKASHQQQTIIANEKHLLQEQSNGRFPQCSRPNTKEVSQGLIAKCELKQSKLYQTKRLCPGCMRYQRGMSAYKSAKARRIRTQSIERIDCNKNKSNYTREETNNIQNSVNNSVIIAETVETIQEEKNALLLEKHELLQKIRHLESSNKILLKHTEDDVISYSSEEILPHSNNQPSKEKPSNQITSGSKIREFSMKLIKQHDDLKRDLAKSQAMVQHHQITISQLNSRVSFLQDQVSTLTFYYSQEAHAHKVTKSQFQSSSQYHHQQLQHQQQFQQQHLQQTTPQQQPEDPLRLP